MIFLSYTLKNNFKTQVNLKPSPLALLAKTCSSIGRKADRKSNNKSLCVDFETRPTSFTKNLLSPAAQVNFIHKSSLSYQLHQHLKSISLPVERSNRSRDDLLARTTLR